MIMSRESILATLVTASALLLLFSGLIFGFKYKSNADAAASAKEQLNSQQLITSSVLRSMSVFNMIARAAHESQENNNAKSKQRIEYIIQQVSTDKCASQLVPSNAASELLRHTDQIRQGSASTDTGKPD